MVIIDQVEMAIRTVMKSMPASPDDDLWDSGLLDSYAIIEVVMAVEEVFGIEIPPEKMRRDNFASVAAIARTISEVQG